MQLNVDLEMVIDAIPQLSVLLLLTLATVMEATAIYKGNGHRFTIGFWRFIVVHFNCLGSSLCVTMNIRYGPGYYCSSYRIGSRWMVIHHRSYSAIITGYCTADGYHALQLPASLFTAIEAGAVITGFSLSVTTMVCVAVDELPWISVTVQVLLLFLQGIH
jgi:hypothetical protein